MKTSTVIEYGAVDVTAKSDSQLSVNTSQTFSDLNKLKRANLNEVKYSTLEKNHFALDGKSTNMGTTVDSVAWWSEEMSDENGDFTTPPVLTINFTKSHSSIGLTLKFSEYAYCNNLKIQYYDSSNNLIDESTFTPDTYEYFCEETVANYRKIVITFYSTTVPYRYLKLYKILYGKSVLFEDDDLVSANLLEQVNLLSDELTINTLGFVVYSNDDEFNILNPQGKYATLQQRQQINAYQFRNNTMYNMGTFYIENWQSKTDNKMEFNCIDLIGLLDKSTFDGGIYSNVTAKSVIQDIFTSAGIDSELYEIQNEINDTLAGYIPKCTHREALQQVLFTIGAIAVSDRENLLKIYKVEVSQTPAEITNIFQGTKEIEQGEIITGVLLKAHTYTQGNQQQKLFDDSLAVGTHKITFSTPVFNLSCTGGTIQSSGANYAIIQVLSAGNVVVNGYEYKDNVQDVFVQNNDVDVNNSNILQIESVYLINKSNASTIGQRIIDHYNNNFTSKFKFVLADENIGENVYIEDIYQNVLNGFITELDIDMTGGYVTKCELSAKVSDD